jgi:hypothetical protein
MSTFKERMQPVIDGLPAGEDKDTLVAWPRHPRQHGAAGFNPGSSARAMRQYLRRRGCRRGHARPGPARPRARQEAVAPNRTPNNTPFISHPGTRPRGGFRIYGGLKHD